MTDRSTITLRELLPPNLRDDPDAIAASRAMEPSYREFINTLEREVVFSGIDRLDDATLNRLAYDLHVDYYDETVPIESRRELVRRNLAIHMTKGTPWAVEQVLTWMFGPTTLSEWFEYGGEPYRFRLLVNAWLRDATQWRALLRAIWVTKNVRSWLDGIGLRMEGQSTLHLAHQGFLRKRYTLHQQGAMPPDARGDLYIGGIVKRFERAGIAQAE